MLKISEISLEDLDEEDSYSTSSHNSNQNLNLSNFSLETIDTSIYLEFPEVKS